MKCRNCGKVFDYEKYYGICPKCGTFNRKNEEPGAEGRQGKDPYEDHIRFHEQYDTGCSHGEGAAGDTGYGFGQDGSHSKYTFVDDGRVPENFGRARKKKSGIGGLIFVIICVCILAGSVIGLFAVTSIRETRLEKEALLSGLSVEEEPFGEPFMVGVHTVEVTGVRILEGAGERPEFPKGEMCIAVSVRRVSSEEYPSYLNKLEFPYLSYEGADGETEYKGAVENYTFGHYEDYYGIQMLEGYDFGYEKEAEGELIYFVEDGASKAVLCFEERERREGEMEKLKKVCEVEIGLPKEVDG